MKDKIPTVKTTVKVGEESLEVEVYEWITDEEEKAIANAMLANMEPLSPKEFNNDEFTFRPEVFTQNIAEQSKLTLLAYLKAPSYEEYNFMKPLIREEIRKVVDLVKDEGKKK